MRRENGGDFMAEKLVKVALVGTIFVAISGFLISMGVATLLYFEWLDVGTSVPLLYGFFLLMVLVTSFLVAREVKARGLLLGLALAGVVIALFVLYRFVGVETGFDLRLLIRSVATLLTSCAGAVIGVNVKK